MYKTIYGQQERSSSMGKSSVRKTRQKDSQVIIDLWLIPSRIDVGQHMLTLLTENVGVRDSALTEIRKMVSSHYVAPEVMTKRLEELGATGTATLLREHLPKTKKARSGDLGEILATEVAEHYLLYEVPIRRLRLKDGRNMALRGDDIIAIKLNPRGKIEFLKGESKSRISLTPSVIDKAAQALDNNRGNPTRHSVLFVAERLREKGNDDIANKLDMAVLNSFKGHTIEHLIFTLSGNNPQELLKNHLESCNKMKRCRHGFGIRIKDHANFIKEIFMGM